MSRSAILHLNTDTNTNNTFINNSGTAFNATLHGTPLHLNNSRNAIHHLPISSQQINSSNPSSQAGGPKNQIDYLQNYNQNRRNSHLHIVQDILSGNSSIKIKTPQKNPLGGSSGGAPATGLVALRKSSLTGSTEFSESSNNNNNYNAPNKSNTLNFYSTMPLSRTRSLLANINGVAGGGGNVSNGGGGTGGSGSTGSGGPGSAGSGNGSSSSSANTPNEQINGITNGFSSSYLPSITTNGSSVDHILPPLKSTPLKTNNSGSGVINSSSAGGILFNGVAAINSTNATISNGYSGTNHTNSASNNSSITNRDYSITNGHNNINHHSNLHHYNNHHHSNHGLTNGTMNNKDLDAISTNSVIMSSVSSNVPQASLTNGISSSGSANSNSNSFHMNGMQTLPLVRHNSHNPSTGGGGTSNNDSSTDRLQQNGTSGGSVAMDASPKHGIQITTVGGGGSSSSTTSTNAINSNIATSVIGGSNNSNNQVNGTISGTNSANTGSLKPKTMVATPEQVMKLYMNKLTPYEHHEIFSYPQIYFIGANAKKRPGIIGGPNNCGYDDDQGSYTHIAHDHLAYRYEVLKVIGKGSFGQVVKAYDHKSHHHVALKMVRNEKRFHRQAQEEIRILEHLRKQDKDNTFNIIHMYDHFTFRSHTCITFELLSINLYELIKKNKFQGFSLQLVRKFAHSLLQCLDLLFRNKIIHCDMKPENVLLKQQGRSGIKVRK